MNVWQWDVKKRVVALAMGFIKEEGVCTELWWLTELCNRKHLPAPPVEALALETILLMAGRSNEDMLICKMIHNVKGTKNSKVWRPVLRIKRIRQSQYHLFCP